MEPLQAFVLTDYNKLELISLARHCILHAVQALQPSGSLSSVLPKSGTHKVESFCDELCEAIQTKPLKKKASSSSLLADQSLIQQLEIHKFCDGATSPAEFAMVIEDRLVSRSSKHGLDLEKVHRTCWNYYEVEKKGKISHPKWLSPTCTYRLWLIFNCVLEHDLKTIMTIRSLNEVLRRIVELCGFKWNDSDKYDGYGTVDFPLYLDVIVSCFENFKLETLLTCEIIGDMVDEIVHGVLKKGYLTKKGHKRKSWKKRWFVLQRTTMSYFVSRDNMEIKGKFVLNGQTKTMSLPDRGKRKYLFEVTCGSTGKPFEIFADDQRMKQEWILAIKKAIALAAVLEGSSKEDNFTDSLAGFYLLKYGTPQPTLSRQDSTIRTMKFQAKRPHQRKRLSGKKISAEEILQASRSSLEDSQEYAPMSPQDEYMPMAPLGINDDNISSDSSSGGEEENYTPMIPLQIGFDESYESCEPESSSLPPRSILFDPPKLHPHSASFSGATSGLNRPPPIMSRTMTHYAAQHSNKVTPTILEPSPEEVEDEDDQSYEEANIKGVNLKLRSRDKQLGGYVEMTLDGQWKDVVETNPDYDDPPDEKQAKELEDDILKKPAASSPDHEFSDSKPKYLTLVRETSVEGQDVMVFAGNSPSPSDHDRPIVPPHRRSLPSDEITPPPISPRHSSAGYKPISNGYTLKNPPPLPPRDIISPHSSLAGVPLPFPTAQHLFHSSSDPAEPGNEVPTSPSHNERLRASSDFDFDPVIPPPLPPR